MAKALSIPPKSNAEATRKEARRACNPKYEQRTKVCVPPGQPPSYIAARKKYGTANDPVLNYGGDCGNFVGTVIRASGVDLKYPGNYTPTQLSYLEKSKQLQEIKNLHNGYSNLLPGDVFIEITGNYRHTYIYIGGGKKAQASLGKQMPWYGGEANLKEAGVWYRIFRFVGK
jgi:hypothetical protein